MLDLVGAKSRNENTPAPEENDINAIDRQQCDEQFIPMPAVLKRRSLLDTGVDPEAINIDILGDGKPCGSVVLSSEDLRMLVRSLLSITVDKNHIVF